MKNFASLIVLALFLFQPAFGQMDTRLKPKSTQYIKSAFAELKEIVLPAFSQADADRLDSIDAAKDRLPKISRHIAVNIDLDNAGSWTNLPTGGRVWRVEITSRGAQGIVPLFDSLYLPEGSSLHAYMPDMREVQGAYTHLNTAEVRSFNAGLVHGETCIIEYYEPATQTGKGILNITQIGHAYRWIDPLKGGEKSGSQSCEVNSICSEGDNWRNQIRSTCRVFVVSEEGDGFCSGALINNVRLDCTPYLLSAGHCTSNDSVTKSEFEQWNFLFNYSASTCAGTDGPTTDVMTGCKRVSYAYDQDGYYGSDFLLLQLTNYPPKSYDVYYSGWDNSGNAPTSGVCISHPAGDITKISTYTKTATSTSWQGNVPDTHWQVQWAATTNGHGVTEPGSSGSPLYNQNGLIVGQLTGGTSSCVQGVGGFGPDGPDDFGKFSFDWTSNGVGSYIQVQPWLDPDNTGATTLAGMNPPCGSAVTIDAGIQSINIPTAITCSDTFTPCFMLRNFGSDSLKKVTITYSIDNGTPSQYSWTGLEPGSVALPAGAETEVCLSAPVMVSEGAHTFTVVTSDPDNTTDDNPNNDVLETNFTVYPTAGSINLVLTTDDDGSQDSWQITQGLTVVASGGPFIDSKGGRTYTYPLCLAPGCYAFTIFDSNGDGMADNENGNFQITGSNNAVVYASLQDASFGAQETDSFCISATGIVNLPAINLNIVPNPSTGLFNVYMDDNGEKTVQLFDALGRVILEKNTSEQHFIIDMTAYSKGVYFASFSTAKGKVVKKLVVD